MRKVVIALVAILLAAGLLVPSATALAKKPADKGGGWDQKTVDVLMSGGMSTDGSQPMKIFENQKRIDLTGGDMDGDPIFIVAINLINTFNDAACTGDRTLKSKLVQLLPTNRTTNVFIDKTSLNSPTDGHRIATHWQPTEGELFSLVIRSPTVTEITDDGPRKFKFTGGTVRVIDRSGKVKDHTSLECNNKDTVTVSITSP